VNRPAAEAQVEAQKAVTAGETAIDKQRITIPILPENSKTIRNCCIDNKQDDDMLGVSGGNETPSQGKEQ
jgi:hypothetical protein